MSYLPNRQLKLNSRGTVVLFDPTIGPSVESNVRLDYAQIKANGFAAALSATTFTDEMIINENWWLLEDGGPSTEVERLTGWPIAGFISEHWINAEELRPKWVLMARDGEYITGPLGFESSLQALGAIPQRPGQHIHRELCNQGMYRIWDVRPQPQQLVAVIFSV
jgi:hypothetical protein